MGSSQSALIEDLKAAVGGKADLLAYPSKPLYQLEHVKPYNLSIPVKPAAITYPETKEQVAAIVKVAVKYNLKVQARCGGHSYANFSIGGTDGAIVIDLKHFQHFSMDRSTWLATAGGGTLLGDLTKRMHLAGGRAMAHGICPQVGLGGHATIGGLGPSSRLWGTALDHIEEVEIVLADSSIVRANATQNQDIFWAVKGAGASFGVVTEFVLRTEEEPGEAVQYSFSFTEGSWKDLSATFKKWQKFVANPELTRKFASQIIVTEVGLIITGTYYGSEKEYDAFELEKNFPGNNEKKTVVFNDWLALVDNWAEEVGLRFGGGIQSYFDAKSLTFNGCDLIPDKVVDELFAYLENTKKGTLIWLVIFDLAGGKVNDVPQDATAYAHRDALFYMQSYAIGVGSVSKKTKAFLKGVKTVLKDGTPGGDEFGAYAGYVDPELENPQQDYWRTNLPRLEQIKSVVDPNDVFHNPQSVRPTNSSASALTKGLGKPRTSRKRLSKLC